MAANTYKHHDFAAGYRLRGSNGIAALDPNLRLLYNSAGITVIDFTGTYPLANTPTGGDNSTKIATTAFVTTALGSYFPLAGGTITGNVRCGASLPANVVIKDGANNNSIAPNVRIMYDTAEQISIRYHARDMYSSGGFRVVDWSIGFSAFNPDGTTTIDGVNRGLYDSDDNKTIDWDLQQLIDPNQNVVAVDWSNYYLRNADDEVVCNWSGANPSLNGKKLVQVADPTASSDVATKSYVDDRAAGQQWKTGVRVATTTNGTLATAFANGQTVDGVTLATGDRILIKDQSTGSENGIYVVAASGAPTRADDANAGSELVNAAVAVSEGTTNADRTFICTNNSITLGVTSITFVNMATANGAAIAANNLSDLTNASTARTNLGLGTAATQPSSAFLSTSAGGTVADDVVIQGTLQTDTHWPSTDGGAALGAGTLAWGGVFIASGGTINFGNGNATITHSPGRLAVNGVTFGAYTNTAALGATPTLNLAANQNQSGTITANCTITFTDPAVPCDISIILTANATGGYTMAWPGNVIWDGGVAPRTVPANETIEIGGRFDGTNHRLGWKPFSKDRLTVTGTTAPADADMANSTGEFYSDATAGNPALKIKFKDAGGTTKTASVQTNQPRITAISSSATPAINTDITDIARITLATNITSLTTNLTGTPSHGQELTVEITADATRTIAWGSSFEDGANFKLAGTTIGTERLTQKLVYNSTTSKWQAASGEINTITFSFDGGGSAITTGAKAVIYVPYSHEIIEATLIGGPSGSMVVDVWKANFSTSALPTVANTITASAKPTLSSATGAQDATLTGWTKAQAAGSYRANVDSCSTITAAALTIKVRKAS